VIDYLARKLPDNVQLEHDAPYILSPGLSDNHNAALAEQLGAVAKSVRGAGKKIGVPFGTDAPAYDALGIPTAVFGPGSIAQAHTADEWIEIDQLHAAVEILTRFVRSYQ
jgi:acetylornithine deacetylase